MDSTTNPIAGCLSPCPACGSPAFFVSVYDAGNESLRRKIALGIPSNNPNASVNLIAQDSAIAAFLARMRCLECYHGHPAMIHSRYMLFLVDSSQNPPERTDGPNSESMDGVRFRHTFKLIPVDERLRPMPIPIDVSDPAADGDGTDGNPNAWPRDPARGTIGGTGRPPDVSESLDDWFDRLPIGAENLLVGVAVVNPVASVAHPFGIVQNPIAISSQIDYDHPPAED